MVQVYLGLGSNIGDKEKNIQKAIRSIRELYSITKISKLYHTEPVGYKQQDWFLNCAVEIETDVHPEIILASLQMIEKKIGRTETRVNGPRTIDIDLLFYGDKIMNRVNLTIPHPRLHDRRFVLQPLLDLNPGFQHPILKKTIRELYDNLSAPEQVQLYKESFL
ncbi:MAG: 2-amino-4-hydroxy-6-hydroxymethyldihydropteridine diphosphokinase [Candidatus Thermoplasmatota archaeon]